jgi:catechol 2,3-dioxygenase-like lactoylglutathione lyase family enzyme
LSVRAKIHADYLHTALRVKDLEGAVRFYTQVVGLNEQRRGANGVWLDGVQLVQAPGDTAEKGVLDHIGFALRNLDEVVASLQANNVELEAPIRETTLPNGQKMRLVFFRDPEGNRIELTERT